MAKKKEANEIWTDIVTKTNVRPKKINKNKKSKEMFPKKKQKLSPIKPMADTFDLGELNVPTLPPKMKDLAMRLKRKRKKNKGY